MGIRPLRADDACAVLAAFRHLSAASRRQRFFSAINQYTPGRVEELTATDRKGRWAVVALLLDEEQPEIVAMAEYVRPGDETRVAEPAIAVLDDYQGEGLGTLLLQLLAVRAAAEGIERFIGTIRDSNAVARRLLERAGAGFALEYAGVVRAELDLRRYAPAVRCTAPVARS